MASRASAAFARAFALVVCVLLALAHEGVKLLR